MKSKPPKKIAINHDDHHADYIGKTADGKQFFLTTPFDPAMRGKAGAEFVALYLFDQNGRLLEAKIENFGPRSTLDAARRNELAEKWLHDLGEISLERIEVAPFALERFGTTFGLVLRKPEDDDDVWAVEMQPGNYMAFFEPWDSGEYDT